MIKETGKEASSEALCRHVGEAFATEKGAVD